MDCVFRGQTDTRYLNIIEKGGRGGRRRRRLFKKGEQREEENFKALEWEEEKNPGTEIDSKRKRGGFLGEKNGVNYDGEGEGRASFFDFLPFVLSGGRRVGWK